MTTRPPALRTLAIGIGIPLVIAVVTAFARFYDQSKVDTTRFVVDSTNSYYERREFRATLFRIDSAVQRIDARLK